MTAEAVRARELDHKRTEIYVRKALDKFHGFKIPVLGKRREFEAEQALKNFYRHPGTNLFENMVNGTDSYRVVCFQKPE